METEAIKYIPEHERAAMAAEDFAGPHRTFPIGNQEQLDAASYLIGHAADPNAVREKAIRIAKRKGLSLPSSWQMHTQNSDGTGKSIGMDMLVYCGGQVKRLEDYKFGADLVMFSTAQDPDTYRDFFDNTTDFDFEDGDRRSLYYDHGFDKDIANTKIGRFSMKMTPTSVWMEGQIDKRIQYADAIMKMIEEGDLSVSSGALSHLVRRRSVGKSNHVTHWPIGEGSLTTEPGEPRTLAIPLKTWAKRLEPPDENTEDTIDEAAFIVKAAFSIATVREFEDFLRDAGYSRKQATAIALHGFNSLRDAGETEPTPTSDDEADDATKQARESKFRIFSARLDTLKFLSESEGLLLTQ